MEPKVPVVRRLSALVVFAALLAPQIGYTRSTASAPPLAAASGAVIRVTSEPQLQEAVHNLRSNTTIIVAAGTYRLTSTLWITGSFANLSIRGETGERDDVVLVGAGWTHANSGLVPYAIATSGNLQGIEMPTDVRDVRSDLV